MVEGGELRVMGTDVGADIRLEHQKPGIESRSLGWGLIGASNIARQFVLDVE